MKKTDEKTVTKGVVTINGKMYKIPQSWEDITVRKYLDLRGLSEISYNEADFLSIMLDCPVKDILKNEDVDFEFEIFSQLEWYRTKPIDLEKLILPSSIKIGDKDFKVTKDIGYKSYGQKVALQDRIKISANADPIEVIPYAIAIYFYDDYYPDIEELPDDDAINAFVDDIVMGCSIVQAYPVGYFFLMRLVESMSSKLKLLEDHILPKRKGRKFTSWRNMVSSK
jgi:hypothetical protein